MITYNPKEWSRFILNFPKRDTFRKLIPWMFLIGCYSWFIAFLEIEYFQLSDSSHLKNFPVLHNLLGFAISMLLVFRTNTAYDRWWEGRKLWGNLINSSRNFAIKLDSMLPAEDEQNRLFFKQIIPRFAIELKNHLQSDDTRFSLDEKPHPEIPDFNRKMHVPDQVAALIYKRLNALYKEEVLSGEELILLNAEFNSLLDICGGCERIKNTPIPYSYSSFIKRFIFLYILTLPIGYVFNLGYLVIPVVIFVFYVLASLELIAEEIEDPFGKDSNDLPMERMSETILKNMNEIFS